jgi:sucrose-phosphate synthase
MDKPVVASAVGGLSETIKHCENGVLFRVGDAQALSKALLSVLTDTLLIQTIVKGARETVKAFDIERHVDRLVVVYEALAAGRPVPAAPQQRTTIGADTAPAQTGTLQQITSDTTI